MIPALLVLLGCGGSGSNDSGLPAEGTSLRVDCLGMVPILDTATLNPSNGTPAILWSDAGQLEGRRCQGAIGDFEGKQPGDTWTLTSAFALRANGQWYRAAADSVEIAVEQVAGDWYFLGSYSGTFVGDDGTVAYAQGWIDQCDQVAHPECPYTIEGVLPYSFESAHPLLGASGEATACRAVIDPATQALQVDMQAAVWNGVNISQLYRTSCPNQEDVNPEWYANRLTFRAGGVTGPGSYGPWRVTDFGGTQLPSLEWTVPTVFGAAANRISMLAFINACGDPTPHVFRTLDWTDYDDSVGVDSQCSFEITDGDPGRVWIECTQVRHSKRIPDELPCFNPSIGCDQHCDASAGTCARPMVWAGACDVVIR